MPNPVTQFQMLSKNPDRTAKFYAELEAVAASIRKAEEMGAKVLIPATKLPEGEGMAVLLEVN